MSGGPETDPDALLTRVFTDYVDAGAPLWRYALRHPRLTVATVRAITRLPAHRVELPSGPESRAVARALASYPTSRRMMLGIFAVLRTPESPGTYSDGRDRATVRRKMRAATKQGIVIRPVDQPDRRALIELADQHEQQNARAAYRVAAPDNDDLLQCDLWLAAYDADGSPLALSVTPCAGEWAVLRYFRTLVPGQASSDARYLMTDALAEALAARGVKHLVDSARPHWLPNGLRHFQRMVGFRLVRLQSVRQPRS